MPNSLNLSVLFFSVGWLSVGLHIVWVWYQAWLRGSSAKHKVANDHISLSEPWPLVSILIPAWEEMGTVHLCIQTLQKVPRPSWEAIVIAGGSDNTYSHAKALCEGDTRFQVIEQPPHGKNAALNLGLAAANGGIVVILDADSQVVSEWLETLVAPIVAGETLVTTGRFLPLRHTAVTRYEELTRTASYEVASDVTLQGAGSIALSKAFLQEELGGFDCTVPVGVDWDLHVRVITAGIRPRYCHQAYVYTARPATLAEFWENEVRWRRAHLAALWRHRTVLLRPIFHAIQQLYLYGLSLVVIGGLAMIGFYGVRGGIHADRLFALWLVLIVWILGRRAALVATVAVYTDDPNWYRLWWLPPLLLVITMLATVKAIATFWQLSPHFKGPRMKI